MKPIIPKEPVVPTLQSEEITYLTNLVFGKEVKPTTCDAIFIFSGTHPGHWETAIEAYEKGYANEIIVTGGKSLTGVPHPDWENHDATEADVIIAKLQSAGIPREAITYETKSTNTLENVLYAKKVYDFSEIRSLMFICKSHVTGRQYRTLVKHLPSAISYVPYTFNTIYKETEVSRENWMETEIGRKRVWGEYLRITHYGQRGDILAIDEA